MEVSPQFVLIILVVEYSPITTLFSVYCHSGFMVMHAASLFRSISPISGYLTDVDPAVTKGGTFCVDGICVDAPGTGKGIFLHHGVHDTFVRPTGCCNDPDMPKCCCNIAADTCVPIMEVARNWALEVNGCELAEEEEQEESGSTGEDEEGEKEKEGGEKKGGEEEEATSVSDDEESGGSTGEEDDKGKDDEEEEEHARALAAEQATGVSSAKFVTSYTDSDRGIECLTTTGADCKANSTICLHEHAGHFNSPSFDKNFPFAKEVINFFAKDACEIHDGKWNETSGLCACPENRGGAFCLDDPIIAENIAITITPASPVVDDDFYSVDSGAASSKGSRKVVIGYFFFALAIWYAVRYRNKRGKKKDDRYSSDVRDEEATELVASRGFRTY